MQGIWRVCRNPSRSRTGTNSTLNFANRTLIFANEHSSCMGWDIYTGTLQPSTDIISDFPSLGRWKRERIREVEIVCCTGIRGVSVGQEEGSVRDGAVRKDCKPKTTAPLDSEPKNTPHLSPGSCACEFAWARYAWSGRLVNNPDRLAHLPSADV